MEIRNATVNDIPGILDLLAKNHKGNLSEEVCKEGFVTTSITAEQLSDLIQTEDSVTVAEDKGEIAAFYLAGSWKFWPSWPLAIPTNAKQPL